MGDLRDVAGSQRGYTLIEMVIALVLTAGVFSALMLWFDRPLQAMLETQRRSAAVELAQHMVEQFAQEIPTALPNSVRVACSGRCLEFIPVLDQGDYRTGAPGDLLDFLAPDASFDVLTPLAAAPAPGTQVVINNLSAAPVGSNSAYSVDPINNRAGIGAGSTTGHIAIGLKLFPAASPTQRFFLIGTAISYLCDEPAGIMRRRAGYAIQALQPTNVSLGITLADRIAECSFAIVDSRLVSLRIAIAVAGSDPVVMFAQFPVEDQS